MTHADRDRSELHAYLAADKADYPRTWKGGGYARAEAAEAKVAELTAEIEQWRAFNMREGEMEDRALAAEAEADEMRADLTEARVGWGTAERALADGRAKVAKIRDLALEWDAKADGGADEYPREARVWAADARELLALLDGLACECPPCPGRGNDGHGMTHCAECCFGSGVVADEDCPIHGRAALDGPAEPETSETAGDA